MQSIINGVTTAYTYDDNDRLTQTGGTVYTYDANGSTLTETLDADVTTYTYNAQNRLVTAQKVIGGTTKLMSYSYDINGIRTTNTVDGVTTSYLVDHNQAYAQVVSETDGTNTIVYTFGDDLISQDRNGALHVFHYDGLGSTRALSTVDAVISDEYNYEAFGEQVSGSGTTENSYLYAGEQRDSDLGLDYLRARYLDVGVGRFTQQDTWMGVDANPITLNKYAYANSDAANGIDPSGNMTLTGVMTTVNVGMTIHGIATSVPDLMSTDFSDPAAIAKNTGFLVVASVGGGKLFKLIGKKFLNKLGCNKPGKKKPICNIVKSDSERIHTLRSTLGIGKRKNIAFADYFTSEGVGTMVAASGKHTHPGTVGMPSSPRFATFTIGHSRAVDSEVKLYENIALKISPSAKGIGRVVSELPICGSCAGVGVQFRAAFPSVFLLTRGGVTGRKSK